MKMGKKANSQNRGVHNSSYDNSGDVFKIAPPILYDNKRKIALLWSAKAGCTFATKWFFFQMNLLDAAFYYDPWIHYYKDNVYYHSSGYKRNLSSLWNDEYTVIKIVRDPFARAVGSYLAALVFLNSDTPVLRNAKAFVKNEIAEGNNLLSFRKFINKLTTFDISQGNIHWREQWHFLEKNNILKPDYIIKLENAESSLEKVERELKLKSSNLSLFRESPHNTKKTERSEFCGDMDFHFDPEMGYPDYTYFYDDELIQIVRSIYRNDFNAYDYEQELTYD
jgi:hypothetical protein